MSACPKWMPVLCTHWLAWASATASRTAGKLHCHCCHTLLRLLRSLYTESGLVQSSAKTGVILSGAQTAPLVLALNRQKNGMCASVLLLLVLCSCASHLVLHKSLFSLNNITQAVAYIAGPGPAFDRKATVTGTNGDALLMQVGI